MRRRHSVCAGLFVSLLASQVAAAQPPSAPASAAEGAAEPAPCPVATRNLFAARTWQPPPPPPRKPEPPKAPPLPFTYMGQLEEAGGIALFLGRDKRTLIVRRGDVVEGAYRIDDVTPERATFVFLPLDERQHLTLRTRP